MRAGGRVFPHGVILLAGGEGKRAGGPKAWQIFDGKPLLESHLTFLSKLFDPEAIAVTIQPDWLDRCRKLSGKVRWVPEPAENTPLAALQAVLSAGVRADQWAFVFHVDMPVWETELFLKLAEASGAGVDAVAPSFQGKKGHPVALSPGALAAIRRLDPSKDRLDHWLRTRSEKVVDVPFSCALANWNQVPRV